MRKIYYAVKIINYEDIGKYASHMIKDSDIHKVELEARIDTGATHFSLPEKIAKKLGLRIIDHVRVRYADNSVKEKPIGSGIEIEILGRRTLVRPVIEENNEVLIGNPILEELDIFINTKTGELYVNPESPDMPIAELLLQG